MKTKIKCRKCGEDKPSQEVQRMAMRGSVMVRYFRQCDECRSGVLKRRDENRVPPKLREKVFARWGKFCLACGRPGMVIDHIVPTFLGGKAIFDNLQVLCGSCNSTKNNKTTDYRRRPCKKA